MCFLQVKLSLFVSIFHWHIVSYTEGVKGGGATSQAECLSTSAFSGWQELAAFQRPQNIPSSLSLPCTSLTFYSQICLNQYLFGRMFPIFRGIYVDSNKFCGFCTFDKLVHHRWASPRHCFDIVATIISLFTFLSDPGIPGVRSMGPDVFNSLQDCFADLTDVTLAHEDSNSIPTDDVNRPIGQS